MGEKKQEKQSISVRCVRCFWPFVFIHFFFLFNLLSFNVFIHSSKRCASLSTCWAEGGRKEKKNIVDVEKKGGKQKVLGGGRKKKNLKKNILDWTWPHWLMRTSSLRCFKLSFCKRKEINGDKNKRVFFSRLPLLPLRFKFSLWVLPFLMHSFFFLSSLTLILFFFLYFRTLNVSLSPTASTSMTEPSSTCSLMMSLESSVVMYRSIHRRSGRAPISGS